MLPVPPQDHGRQGSSEASQHHNINWRWWFRLPAPCRSSQHITTERGFLESLSRQQPSQATSVVAQGYLQKSRAVPLQAHVVRKDGGQISIAITVHIDHITAMLRCLPAPCFPRWGPGPQTITTNLRIRTLYQDYPLLRPDVSTSFCPNVHMCNPGRSLSSCLEGRGHAQSQSEYMVHRMRVSRRRAIVKM